eukprot:COSAG01_NODE_4424_length_5036_cov_12.613936_5_plen_184_part_00
MRGAPIIGGPIIVARWLVGAAADLVGGGHVVTCPAMSVVSEFPNNNSKPIKITVVAPGQVVAAAEAGPTKRILVRVVAIAIVGELLQRIAELEEEVGLGNLVVNTAATLPTAIHVCAVTTWILACPGALVEPAKGFFAARRHTYTHMPVCQYCEPRIGRGGRHSARLVRHASMDADSSSAAPG